MKLSSTIFIAAALAAIAGSAIAAPSPLYVRALGQFNSFEPVYPRESGTAVLERDVDGEPVDSLFARSLSYTRYQRDHIATARVLMRAALYNHVASRMSNTAGSLQRSPSVKEEYRLISESHGHAIRDIVPLIIDHIHAASSPDRTRLHASVTDHQQRASDSIAESQSTIDLAWDEIQHPQ